MESPSDVAAIALEDAYERGQLYAGAVGLIVDARVIEAATVGATRQTRFEIGSITKMLTAAAAIKASDDHGLDLDARLEDMVPGLEFDDRRGASVTLRQLLTHSSGLPAAGRDWGPAGPDALSRFATSDIAHHRFHARPGEIGRYSSTAISLVGLALQEMSGLPFHELLRSEILGPAGMSTTVYPPEAGSGTVSWPHSRAGSGWVPVPRLADNPAGYPSGFLLASLEDLLRFASSMIDGSLIVDGLDRMADTSISRWTGHATVAMARTSAFYGLGSFTGHWKGETVIRHGGQQLTSNCSLDFFPESRSGIVLLTNGADDATFMDLLATCYRVVAGSGQDRTSMPRQSPRLERLQAAVGTFLDVDSGIVAEVSLDEGLWLQLGADMLALQYVGRDRWIASGAGGEMPIGIPWSEGISDHVVIWGDLHSRIDPIDARRGIPDEFCGRYVDSFWDEAESRISVERHGRQLVVSREGLGSVARPVRPCRVVSAHGLMDYEPGGAAFVLGNATRYVKE